MYYSQKYVSGVFLKLLSDIIRSGQLGALIVKLWYHNNLGMQEANEWYTYKIGTDGSYEIKIECLDIYLVWKERLSHSFDEGLTPYIADLLNPFRHWFSFLRKIFIA